MPGLLAGLLSALMAAMASESTYGIAKIYEIWPARAPAPNTPDAMLNFKTMQATSFLSNQQRSGSQQGLYQLIALVVTFLIANITGYLTGKL